MNLIEGLHEQMDRARELRNVYDSFQLCHGHTDDANGIQIS